jgi:TonB-dependent SusC/RagA subfamily outer membrane receptor
MKESIARRVLAVSVLGLLIGRMYAQNAGVTFHVEDLEPIERTFHYSSSYYIANTVVKYNATDYRNGVIKSSIDGDSLLFLGTNSFYKGMINAFASHRAVVLSPDVIWLLISQGFAAHVNLHSEELRDKIVYHQGKKTLEVESPKHLLYAADEVDWESIFNEFEKQIRSNTKNQIADIITADFSTTGITEKIASQITLMESVKKYFEYKVMTLGCGIPDITLMGTPDDWRKVREKAQSLKGYGLDWWIDQLDPILKQFVDASQGVVDNEFWMEMVGSAQFRLTGCGMPTGDTELKFDGWFTTFYPYNAYGDRITGPITYNSRLLPEVVETPFTYEIRDLDGTVIAKYDMLLYAGIIGLRENPVNGALKPEIGWMVRCNIPDNERDYYYDSIRTDIPNAFALPLQNDEKEVNRLISSSPKLNDRSLELWNPLVVLDGHITKVDQKKLSEMVSNDDFTQESVADLLGLKTKQIKNISLLKDAAAIAIWGARGMNGVLEVQSGPMKEQSKKKTRKRAG